VQEQKYIANSFPELHYKISDHSVSLSGIIRFNVVINDILLADFFKVKLVFPDEYPEMYPKVFELSNKIPDTFHTYSDHSLCLATNMELASVFFSSKSIGNFIENLLLPYLCNFVYFRNHGELPFGDREHGFDGKLQFYQEIFNTKDTKLILRFLCAIYKKNLRGHHPCPCGSQIVFRKCHWLAAQKLLIIPTELINEEITYLKLHL